MGLRDQWYKNAVVYCLDVETYADSNGDGVGDFAGLTGRLDYLSGLGITCLWLMPFYATPNGDDGYDVMDYTAIDPRLGTMADFDDFMVEARERGMHVVVDLVPNHTSIEHPWFQAAKSDPTSPYRDYYVWRTDDPGDTSDQVVFPGEQDGVWSWDDQAEAYYLHHFYPFQADLNFANAAVREEFRKIMGLWLQQGVGGFRIDAAPFLIMLDDPQVSGGLREAHAFLSELRDFASVRTGNAVLIGEVDVGLTALADYFGGGNELQALFNFPLNRFTFLALAQESADPIKFELHELPTIPGVGQWLNFLRHHDELNLSRLTKEQREQVFRAFGPEPGMQIYGRGLRRRLAPMLGSNTTHLRLAYSLLFSLPGAPMIFYGEEVGMGEELSLPGRLSLRTPMQWTPHAGGGFSTAPTDLFVRPMVASDEFGHRRVNVAVQRGDPESLLNWMARLIRVRRECPEIGTGQWQILDVGSDHVLGMRYDSPHSAIVVLNNLSRTHRTVVLPLAAEDAATATDLFGDRRYEALHGDGLRMRISGYGYRWLRLHGMY